MIIGTRPLCDWVIRMFGQRNFLGKPVAGSADLSPVYEFRTIATPQVGIVRQVVPVLFYDIKRLFVEPGCPTINLNELPIAEVEILQKAVEECEKAMIELRAHQTGIVTATAVPKTPLISP